MIPLYFSCPKCGLPVCPDERVWPEGTVMCLPTRSPDCWKVAAKFDYTLREWVSV